MSLGRRKIGLAEPSEWIFNRMVEAYVCRPAYPEALVTALLEIAVSVGSRVADIGAGVGHLALPLAARGLDVLAIDPAEAMLARLQKDAVRQKLRVRTLHAAAERLPLESASIDLLIVADAIHFLDQELAAAELSRVLAPRGALAVLTWSMAPTPYMQKVIEIMQGSAPRRPRDVVPAIAQISALTKVRLNQELAFRDHTAVDRATLEMILKSISFIGPAMNPARFSLFIQRIHALGDAPIWSRDLTLHFGRRGRGGIQPQASSPEE